MKKQVFRTILTIAGALTVVVILLSQSLHLPPSAKEARKSETSKQLVIQAPSDVVTSPSVELNEVFPLLIHAFTGHTISREIFHPAKEILLPYFIILFGDIISPNAP